MNRRIVLRSLALLTTGFAGCGGSGQRETGYGDWFENVANFEGTVDRTGRESVRVAVGAQGNGGGFAFEPAAVAVSPGTVIDWVWTGEGGEHNVVAEDGSFSSEYARSEGYTYSRQFDQGGVHLYYCKPHVSLGMKGAIRVDG